MTPYYYDMLNMCRMYNRLCKMDDNRLHKKIFMVDVSANSDNWFTKKVCLLYDMEVNHEQLEPMSFDLFKSKAKDTL